MEVDARQSLREDRMSDCRSFGSNYHPSSQSRKISIGVMIDSVAKRKPGATREDEGKLPDTERTKPSTGISTEGKDKGEAFTAAKGKQTVDSEQVNSPWITPRSFHENCLAPEIILFPEETSKPRKKKLNAVKDVPVTYSIQFFPNQTLNAQNGGSNQNKLDGLACKRKGRKDGNSERVEELDFVNGRNILESDKVVLEDKSDKTQNVQTETLKMKLQELLGTVSSPKSRQYSSQSHEVNANNLKPEKIADRMGDKIVKPRQNSDTIETDSDNPDKTMKRPVTRSLTRKRVPAKVKPEKAKVGLSSKQKHPESTFVFEEGSPTKLHGAVNSGSTLSTKKKMLKKSSKIDPRKISFLEEDNADEIQQTTYRSETPLPAEETSLLGNNIESFPVSISEKRRENFEKLQEKYSFHSPVTKETNQQFDFDNPTSPEKGDKVEEDFGNISLKNVVYAQDDFQSPTFGFKTPALNTSPSPTAKIVEIEQGDCSPVPSERGFTIGNIWSFRTFQTSRPICKKSNAQAQSPDHAEKRIDSSPWNLMLSKEKVDAVSEHSDSSSEERWSESSEEGSPIVNRYDCHKENIISPETVIAEKPNFVHCEIKRFPNHEDVRLTEFNPASPSQKGAGIGESYWFQEPSQQDKEDESTRAVTLFALAFETFKQKMDLATRKKSSAILMSISEEIKSLLLNAESQIESDVGKLTNLSKTTRKRLETRLQEQQEQLKLILEKFEEDIHNHLWDCRSTLEGMEAHQIELKGIMKKQKVSHEKLLMHVEEAVQIQLNDAERRVTAIHESTREQMFQLKQVVAECLKDGIY